MIPSSVPAANAWLKSRHIHVPGDWLEACVDWITEENQRVQLSQTQLNGLIFEQWLLADLHEIGSSCLPEHVTSSKEVQINGMFALQVDSMVDVGKPYYGQLQRVQGASTGNMEVTAEPTPPWEPKPTRMMLLNLTDGNFNVQGMEYKQIPSLNNQIKPGCKILVRGRVRCRRGILMLTSDNVTVLGGEVDSLVESNTPQSVLKQEMEQSLQYSGKEYHQEFSGSDSMRAKKKIKVESMSKPQQSAVRGRAPEQSTRNAAVPKQEAVKVEDEWGDDIELDSLLEEDFDMDAVPPPPATATNQNCRQWKTNAASNKQPFKTGPPESQTLTQYQRLSSQSVPNPATSVRGNTGCEDRSFQRAEERQKTHDGHLPVRKTNLKTEVCNASNNSAKYSDNTLTASQTMVKTSIPQKKRISGLPDNAVVDEELFDDMDDFDIISVGDGYSVPPAPCTGSQGTNKNTDNRETSTAKNQQQQKSLLPVQRKKLFNSPQQTIKEEKASQLVNSQKISPPCVAPAKTVRFQREEKTKEKPISIAITSPLKTTQPIRDQQTNIPELPCDAKPFTYLAFIKKRIPVSQPITFKVKAYVSTLTDKLSRPAGIKWQLPCKINDGSAVMDVNLSDKVLTHLIGFSAPETMEMKHMKPDSFLMKKLNKVSPISNQLFSIKYHASYKSVSMRFCYIFPFQ
ncbi:recQ-mediated genome instability protein 1-like [Saccostrea cucullata]|uniref:recQ-mediated genome instability protein 1-like n=1 Tax=Saccostrea cuccullata TaxID=36930 RepID=UPI002ED4BB12